MSTCSLPLGPRLVDLDLPLVDNDASASCFKIHWMIYCSLAMTRCSPSTDMFKEQQHLRVWSKIASELNILFSFFFFIVYVFIRVRVRVLSFSLAESVSGVIPRAPPY